MAVVSREGEATPFQVEPYHTFGERVPALRSFYLAYDHDDDSPEDHRIARLAVMVGGAAEDLSPGAGFPPANIPDGQLEVALYDADPGGEEFFYKVSHSVLPPPSVARRYQIRQAGNAGEVVRKLPREIFQAGPIPQPHRQPPILALVGFRLFFSGNRDHELDQVGIWFRDDELHVVFRDQGVSPVETYSFLVDFVAIHPGPQMSVSRSIERGTATGDERVVSPTPSHAHSVLTGWAFNFTDGDNEIRDIGLKRTREDFKVFYRDKDGGDTFGWRIEWAHIGPPRLAPASGASTVVDTSYTADSDPKLTNPERGMYYGKPPASDDPDCGDPASDDPDSHDYHTIVAKWLWLAPVCKVNLIWNGYNQTGTSPVLNEYALNLEDARRCGYKILFRPRYDEAPGGKVSDNCTINGVKVFHADTMERQKDHIDAVAAMLGEYKDVIAYIQAGYLGNWGEWNWGEDGKPYTSANAPMLYNISERNEIIDYVLAAYDAAGIEQDVELRRPVFAKEVVKRNSSAKVGLHNDCFMTTTSDMGTYSNFDDCVPSTDPDAPYCPNFATSEDAKAWAEEWTENHSFGGETCPEVPTGSERWLSCDNMTSPTGDPAKLHLCYLNGDFSPKAVETWKGDGAGIACYDEIRRRLGYRFEVTRVEYTPTVAAGQMFRVRVAVKNTGWAKLHKPRIAKLVLRNGATTHVHNFSPDAFSPGAVATWAPGQTTTISISAPAPGAGTYSMRLWIPDPDAESRIPYAVKLATRRNGANVFDPNTGENDLDVSITVQ